jgi:hypothetical protein
MILNIGEINSVDFNEVLQTSPQSLRKSVDGSKTFVKWIGEEIPNSVKNLQSKEGPYTHSEILNILKTEEWYDRSNDLN